MQHPPFSKPLRPVLRPNQGPIQWVPGLKGTEREGNYSPPSNDEVIMTGVVPQLPLCTFMAWIGRNLTFNCNFIQARPDRL